MKQEKTRGKKLKGIVLLFYVIVLSFHLIPGKMAEASYEPTEIKYNGENYTVTLAVTSQWADGFNANVVIENTGSSAIENWSMGFELPYEITNIWNAEVVTYENGEYFIKNGGHNQDIEPQSKVYLGFTASGTGELVFPTAFEMQMQEQNVSQNEIDIRFNVMNDWETAFNGEIVIENLSEQAIEDWALEFDFEHNITNFWSANIVSHENAHYQIKNKGWNADINPGETLTLGFSAEPGGVKEYPTNFILKQIKTGEQEQTQISEIRLTAFSEYGLNLLEWEMEDRECIREVLRRVEGEEFTVLAEIAGANYFVDTEAESGKRYEYQLVVKNISSNEVVYSDIVTVVTTEQVTDIPENPVKEVRDLMILESDYASLQIEYGKNDWEKHVSESVGLRVKGEYGSDITWESSDKKLVSDKGVVTRCKEEECVVVLTATLRSGNYVSEKEFYLTVIRADQIVTEVPEVSWEDIKELNSGVLPEIQFDSDGDIKRVCGKYTDMFVFTENDAKTSLKGLQELLGIKDVYSELILDRESEDVYGKVFSFDQCYNGVPILGADIIIHAADNGETEYLSSSYIKNLSVDMETFVSDDELMKIAKDRFQATDISTELFLFRKNVEEDTVTLCYEVITKGEDAYRVFVDAKTAEVIYSEPMIRSAQSTTTVAKDINGDEKTVPVTKSGMFFLKKYYLEDKNKNIHICDGTGISNEVSGNSVYTTMTSKENVWTDSVAITAYNYTIQAYDYFDETFEWKGYDGKNGNMKVVVHYQEEKDFHYFEMNNINDLYEIYLKYEIDLPGDLSDLQRDIIGGFVPSVPSEVWNDMVLEIVESLIAGLDKYVENGGEIEVESRMVDVNNAFSAGNTLLFGDGDGKSTKSYASALDIVAHEFTHSITGTKLELLYSNQAGAINEAYSDIFGELIDNDGNWLHGVEHHIGELKGKAGRNIECPEDSAKKEYPSMAYMDNYQVVCSDRNHDSHNKCDNGYVHNNSTVISHAAYLMSQKGLTDEELGKLWFKSYDYYYNESTPDFQDCREAVVLAAKRIGLSEEKIGYVKEAFDEVNITSNDITITLLDALTNEVLPLYVVELVSVDKTHCKLTGECCDEMEHRGMSCDPEVCWHRCDDGCSDSCDIADERCCARNARKLSFGMTDLNGEVKFDDVMSGYHRVCLSSLSYENINELVYVDNSSNNFVFLLESPYKNSIEGCVLKSDDDNDASNNEVIAWAKVILTKKTGNKELNVVKYTDSEGKYCFDKIPAGEYEVIVEKIGYTTKAETVFVERNQNLCLNFYLDNASTKKGYASGTITDSLSGEGVSDLTLYFQEGINRVIPTDQSDYYVVGMAKTDEYGKFRTPALEEGYYTAVICDKREDVSEEARYSTSFLMVKVLKNQDTKNQNGAVLVNQSKQQMRVVLEWEARTKDLDLGVSIGVRGKSMGAGKSTGILYFEKSWYEKIEYGIRHNDSVNGEESENITLYLENIDGVYSLSVSNYSDWMKDYEFKNSGAKVSVYMGDSDVPCKVYYPTDGKGVFWNVFSYDSKNERFFDENYIFSMDDPFLDSLTIRPQYWG